MFAAFAHTCIMDKMKGADLFLLVLNACMLCSSIFELLLKCDVTLPCRGQF